MAIHLPDELQRYVQEKLDTGRYASIDDVIAEALTVLRNVERALPEADDDLRREIEAGLKDIEEGRVSEWRLDEMKEQIRQLAKAKKAV